MTYFKTLLFLILFSNLVISQNAQLWKAELNEPIKEYNFINQDKYIFFTNGEYIWCYDAISGKEIWSKEVPDWEKEGISYLLGELYLTNSDNKLQAYDAITGKMFWEKEYDDISQSDYLSIVFINNNAVFRYGDIEVGIDLDDGNELFRMEVEYWGELVDRGSFNYEVFDQHKKMLVMEEEKAVLFDITTGKRLFEGEDYDINFELIENGFPWLYQSPGNDYLVFVLKDGATVIDVKNNKEIARKEFDIDGDLNVLLPTKKGCAVMGEEKFVHFNFVTNEIKEFLFPIDDLRTLHSYSTSGKDLLIVSMEDKLASIDLAEGKVLWQTNEDDPEFEGYAHKYYKDDGNNIILTYVRAAAFSNPAGTTIYLMNIDGITGKVNFKKPVIYNKGALMGFQRAIAKGIIGAFSTFISATAGQAGNQVGNNMTDMVNNVMGYDNIGIEYSTFEIDENNLIFYSGGVQKNMLYKDFADPNDMESPGEGFVSINYKTGTINYQNYFPIGGSFDHLKQPEYAPINIINKTAYIAGDDKLIKFDLNSGKKLWESSLPDKHVMETAVIGNELYARFGVQDFHPELKEKEINIKWGANVEPYGLVAFDDLTGNQLWEVNTESALTSVALGFTIPRYFNPDTQELYFGDFANLYALKMGKNGGNFSWKLNLEENDIGNWEISKTYSVVEKWIGSVPHTTSRTTYMGGGWSMTTTRTTGGYNLEETSKFIVEAADADAFSTYQSWGSIWGVYAKKCLRILFGSNKMVIFGNNKVAVSDSKTGNIDWSKEWDFETDNVQYIPQVMNNKIVYCMDEQLVVLDLFTGKELFSSEINGRSRFFASPNKTLLFNIYDEEISAFSLN